MPEDEQEPTQPTQPVKGEPIQIPVPKREDVLRNLRKVAKSRRREPPAPSTK